MYNSTYMHPIYITHALSFSCPMPFSASLFSFVHKVREWVLVHYILAYESARTCICACMYEIILYTIWSYSFILTVYYGGCYWETALSVYLANANIHIRLLWIRVASSLTLYATMLFWLCCISRARSLHSNRGGWGVGVRGRQGKHETSNQNV